MRLFQSLSALVVQDSQVAASPDCELMLVLKTAQRVLVVAWQFHARGDQMDLDLGYHSRVSLLCSHDSSILPTIWEDPGEDDQRYGLKVAQSLSQRDPIVDQWLQSHGVDLELYLKDAGLCGLSDRHASIEVVDLIWE